MTADNPTPKHQYDCPYNYGHNCSCLKSDSTPNVLHATFYRDEIELASLTDEKVIINE